jgi:hypothetical protein
MADEVQNRLLRQIYGEIVVGYSICEYIKKNIFIKHFSTIDQLEQDYLFSKDFAEAVKKGYPTEEDRINQLKTDGIWSDENEKIIESVKISIKSLYTAKRKAFRQADFDSINSQIKEQEKILLDKIQQRINLIGSTAEKFTQKRVDAYLICNSLFKDKELAKKLFTSYEFDNLEQEESEHIYNIYYNSVQSLSENNIKKIALATFFQNVFQLAESIHQFFSKPLASLTCYQVQLCAYGNFYKSILSGEPKPPEEIASNPDRLEDWFFGRTHAEEMLKKVDKGEGGSLVGLTDKDREFLGLENVERIPMSKKIKEAGGELSFDQIRTIEGD